MENNKMLVAITQGDTCGTGYEMIFKTFAEPEMLELCTPVIYGSPKAAERHTEALGMQVPYSIISNIGEALEGRINLLACAEEFSDVNIGETSTTSLAAAVSSLGRALSDGREGLFSALVVGPMEAGRTLIGEVDFPGVREFMATSLGMNNKPQTIYANGITRTAVLPQDGGTEGMAVAVKALHGSLKRDFLISNPRIAILDGGAQENGAAESVVRELANEGIQAFGPYQAEKIFAEGHYRAFDGIMATSESQRQIPSETLTDTVDTAILSGMPLVCVMPVGGAMAQEAGKGEADETPLRDAVYYGVDIFRHRREYDEPGANPLQKLYRERPDSGEKLRFSVAKKKED